MLYIALPLKYFWGSDKQLFGLPSDIIAGIIKMISGSPNDVFDLFLPLKTQRLFN